MNRRKHLAFGAWVMTCAGVILSALPAHAASLKISLGVRETAQGGGANVGVFNNGGTAGGIEFIDLDAQTLTLDDTWQQFSWNLSNPTTVTAFAGTTANSVLEGAYGTLEHLRLRLVDEAGPIHLYLDDLTYTPAGAGPTVIGWEGLAVGTEAVFQEPSFSGSTTANLLGGSISAVVSSPVHSGDGSYHLNFEFVDVNPARWVRLTTFNTPTFPNPMVPFDGVLSIWIRGTSEPGGDIPEPATALLVGLFAVGMAVRRTRRRAPA